MYVSTILSTKGSDVVTVEPEATVGQAVALLAEKKIGVVVVSSDGKTAEGVLSERDIVRALAVHHSLENVAVSALMSRDVITCTAEDTISALMSLMTERRIRHLPVVKDGALAGIISIGDVVKFRLAEIESEAEALRDYVAHA